MTHAHDFQPLSATASSSPITVENKAPSVRAKRVGAYLRVSKDDQTVNLQSDEICELVDRRSWNFHCTFSDEGISGAKKKRPGLNALLEAARKRQIDIVVVYRGDRLFRSALDFLLVLDELRALGVDYVSVTEPFDTTTPSGRLLLGIVAHFAEFERETLRERTRSGVAAARRRGKQLGRPRRYVDINRARVLHAKGKKWDDVATLLGCSRAKLMRELAAGGYTKRSLKKVSRDRA